MLYGHVEFTVVMSRTVIEAILSRTLDVSREVDMWILPSPLNHNDLPFFYFKSCTFSFFFFLFYLFIFYFFHFLFVTKCK